MQFLQTGLATLILASSITADYVKPPEGVLYVPLKIPTAEAYHEIHQPIVWTPEYAQERIIFWSGVWKYSSSTALLVAKCESGFDHEAIGDMGKAVGIFQFWPQTFTDFAREFGDETLSRDNPEHNIKL